MKIHKSTVKERQINGKTGPSQMRKHIKNYLQNLSLGDKAKNTYRKINYRIYPLEMKLNIHMIPRLSLAGPNYLQNLYLGDDKL